MTKAEKRVICPTCKQDMTCGPRNGSSGKDCPQCGQGLSKSNAKRIAALAKSRRKP